MPDVAEAVAELAEFIKKAWRTLGPLFKDVYAGHDESRCLYMDDTVVCTFLAVTMLKCRSRNAADGCRNSEGMAASMLYLSDQPWWPEGEKFTTACTGTLVYRTKGWDCEKVKIVNASLVKRLINATNANKVWYYLMQIAWTLWQMFQRGFLLRLETGCRKMTQVLWCEELRTYIRHFGCVMLVARYRLMCRKNL